MLTINDKGQIFLGSETTELPIAQLVDKLKAVTTARGAGTDERIYVKGARTAQYVTVARESLSGREPQGMAIWRSLGGPRLAFGFSSKISGSPDQFRATVFYKSDLTG